MKKYLNSVITLLVAMSSLSIFYANQAFSSSNQPDFYIKPTTGDAKLLDTLALQAGYTESDFVEDITITKKGTDYLSELSFFEQMDYWQKTTKTAEIKELNEQYSSFMRGKRSNELLYNDTKQVIYVDYAYDFSTTQGMHNFRLKINQLHKKTKDTNSFEVSIPNQKNSSYIDILDVQVIMDELRVMTISEGINDGDTQTVHEYTIDLKREKLIDDHSILTSEKRTEQQGFYITGLTDINPTQANTYFIFRLDKTIYEEESESNQTVNSDFYAYNYKTGKVDKLKLSDDLTKKLLQEGEYYLAYDNSTLYASLLKDENGIKAINMIKYDFKNQKITKDHTIQIGSEMINQNINIYQNKMILTYSGEQNKPFIKIFNFDNGKSIFEGTIEVKNNNQKVDYKDFYIYEVNGL